jgi:hypothetical protein
MAELQARIDELEILEGQTRAMGISITEVVSAGTLIMNHDTNPFPSGDAYEWPKY